MKPDRMGEANQEATMRKIRNHLIESQPRSTMEKPIVAPTILCVPDMGILKNVATIFHVDEPKTMDHSLVELSAIATTCSITNIAYL